MTLTGEVASASIASALSDVPQFAVPLRVAAKISTLETPASVMAVFPLPEAPALGELRSPRRAGAVPPAGGNAPLVVYADRIADPGNLGTLVRAAAAFAAAALVASPGSADLFSPKVVRAEHGRGVRAAAVLAHAARHGGRRRGAGGRRTASWRTADGRSTRPTRHRASRPQWSCAWAPSAPA